MSLNSIVGIFINSLPVVIHTEENATVKELLTKVNNELVDSRDYEYMPLAEIQKLSNHTDKLFDSLMVFENYPLSSASEGIDLGFTVRFDSVQELTNYDMSITVSSHETIVMKLAYNTELFTEKTMNRIESHLYQITDALLADADRLVEEISIITDAEKAELLVEFNRSELEFSRDKTIYQLFEEQVNLTPDKPAVVFEDQSLTYRELNAKANQLARILREKGVAKDQIVGIMVERSQEMIIGILGILKAGGAYLPIDYEYPAERISYMLEDSEARILLTNKALKNLIQFTGEMILIEDQELYTGDSSNLNAVNGPTDLAYLIYTSGSTGKPKGVMVEHTDIANLKEFFAKWLGVTSEDRIVQFATCAFDASVGEEYMWGNAIYSNPSYN